MQNLNSTSKKIRNYVTRHKTTIGLIITIILFPLVKDLILGALSSSKKNFPIQQNIQQSSDLNENNQNSQNNKAYDSHNTYYTSPSIPPVQHIVTIEKKYFYPAPVNLSSEPQKVLYYPSSITNPFINTGQPYSPIDDFLKKQYPTTLGLNSTSTEINSTNYLEKFLSMESNKEERKMTDIPVSYSPNVPSIFSTSKQNIFERTNLGLPVLDSPSKKASLSYLNATLPSIEEVNRKNPNRLPITIINYRLFSNFMVDIFISNLKTNGFPNVESRIEKDEKNHLSSYQFEVTEERCLIKIY